MSVLWFNQNALQLLSTNVSVQSFPFLVLSLWRIQNGSSAVLCHFKEGTLGSFWAGKSLIQCHTYILVPMTYYSHLYVGRKQILKNILWSSTHWSAWNFSSVEQLKGRRSRNIICTIFKKKKKENITSTSLGNYCHKSLVFLPSVSHHTFAMTRDFSVT